MAGNTNQILSRVGVIGWGTITAANTAADGTGTVTTVFTADVTNGGRVERLRFQPLGTNVATVARVFVNNGSTNTVAANNTMVAEITLPATTVTQVAAQTPQDLPNATELFAFPVVLPPGYKINVTLGTAIAAGVAVSAHGGAY